MTGVLQRLYHRLPGSAQSIAASSRGAWLKLWRYGSDTETLVGEVLERDRWPPSRWRTWQRIRLEQILRRAERTVPFYRNRDSGSQPPYVEDPLEAWPFLEKESVRRAPRDFLSIDRRAWRMFHEHTSGTTAKPLDLWWSRATVRYWYALFEARARRWNGVTQRDVWANIGGQLVVPVGRRRPPFWVWNSPMRQLYLSSYHLSPALLQHYFEAIRRYGVTHLIGYPSSLYELALGVLAEGAHQLRMKVVITNAERLEPHQRAAISEAFRCPVRETYGMAEIVVAASECEAGGLHLWPEVGIVEVWNGNRRCAPGETGEFVCTGLINEDMPLIRYRTGDLGAMGDPEEPCECGRGLPCLKMVEGRSDDVLVTRDGRRVGRLDPVFKRELRIHEAQIVQESVDRVIVRIVKAEGFSEKDEGAIKDELRDRLGDVEVGFEFLSVVPREPNGKFRAVVCRVPQC